MRHGGGPPWLPLPTGLLMLLTLPTEQQLLTLPPGLLLTLPPGLHLPPLLLRLAGTVPVVAGAGL